MVCERGDTLDRCQRWSFSGLKSSGSASPVTFAPRLFSCLRIKPAIAGGPAKLDTGPLARSYPGGTCTHSTNATLPGRNHHRTSHHFAIDREICGCKLAVIGFDPVPGPRIFPPPEKPYTPKDGRISSFSSISYLMKNTSREIVVVGGGIAGLYCSYHLARNGWRVKLYEATDRFGGRIYTWPIDKERELWADLGAMRIEPDLQVRLGRLLHELGSRDMADDKDNAREGDLIGFPEYTSQGKRAPKFKFKNSEEKQQETILGHFKLAMQRICPRLESVPWSPRAKKQFDALRKSAKGNSFGTCSETALQEWAASLSDADYDQLRQVATYEGTPLWKIGLWNLLSDVLEHMAVIRIRDWGTFFHIIPENPNSVEWLIVWLKGLVLGEKLRTVKGGMERIIDKLLRELQSPSRQGQVSLERGKKLTGMTALKNGGVRLVFEDVASGRQSRVESGEVILALPKRPLEHLRGDLPPQIGEKLDAVIGFPLVKCFFLCDYKWWGGPRRPNDYAEVVPTRELWYWPNDAESKVLVMVYADRPAVNFWLNYLPVDGAGCKLESWGRRGETNDRLERKFVKYLQDNGATKFSHHNLIDYGMIDWSQEPYGAGCHVWRPGAQSWQVKQAFKAFSLTGTGRKNIHICGEAFSDYQGFIEGALSSADDVLASLGIDPVKKTPVARGQRRQPQ